MKRKAERWVVGGRGGNLLMRRISSKGWIEERIKEDLERERRKEKKRSAVFARMELS